MDEWLTSPMAWAALVWLLSLGAGTTFALGLWRGRVDSDRAWLKELTEEIRDDIKEILRRLPSDTSHTPAGADRDS